MSTLTEFLLARIAEDEAVATALLRDLEGQIEAEGFAADERGPFTPARMLAAQLWAHYDGQTRWRNFERGQHIATLATPTRVLAECEGKRAIVAHLADAERGVARAQRLLAREGNDSRDAQEQEFAADAKLDAVKCIAKHVAAVYADHPDYLPEWKN